MRYVPIEIGGKTRHLRYDMNALAAIEETLNISLDQLEAVANRITTLRALLWAGLLHEEPTLTLRDVGAWVDMEDIQAVGEKITHALEEVFAAEGNQARGPKVGIGTE